MKKRKQVDGMLNGNLHGKLHGKLYGQINRKLHVRFWQLYNHVGRLLNDQLLGQLQKQTVKDLK